ncbi:hypothetical protein K474DRAFT_1712836, partial [Panus rudis PR-1116 ss-1]
PDHTERATSAPSSPSSDSTHSYESFNSSDGNSSRYTTVTEHLTHEQTGQGHMTFRVKRHRETGQEQDWVRSQIAQRRAGPPRHHDQPPRFPRSIPSRRVFTRIGPNTFLARRAENRASSSTPSSPTTFTTPAQGPTPSPEPRPIRPPSDDYDTDYDDVAESNLTGEPVGDY